MTTLRLIIDPPAAGAWNMATDEALLESAAQGLGTFRFYAWREPTLSLGYFQSESEREGHAASRHCPLIRRASGGGAIVHDQELTYCLAIPIRERFGREAASLYDIAHATLVESLQRLGAPARLCEAPQEEAAPPFLCFQRRTRGDVLCGSAKIAGSAQRRRRGGLIQHGSILLKRSAYAPELPGVQELTSTEIRMDVLRDSWTVRLAERLSLDFRRGGLIDSERERISRLVKERFDAQSWSSRR